MPPALSQTDGSCEILSEDSQLEGLHDTNFVFTDITYGLPDRVGHSFSVLSSFENLEPVFPI